MATVTARQITARTKRITVHMYLFIYESTYTYTRVSVISNSKVLVVFLNNFYKGNKLFILPKLFYFSHVYFDWNYFFH